MIKSKLQYNNGGLPVAPVCVSAMHRHYSGHEHRRKSDFTRTIDSSGTIQQALKGAAHCCWSTFWCSRFISGENGRFSCELVHTEMPDATPLLAQAADNVLIVTHGYVSYEKRTCSVQCTPSAGSTRCALEAVRPHVNSSIIPIHVTHHKNIMS